eukprot:scaffold206002_cov28-Tisochrysis_lutea.AAC.1
MDLFGDDSDLASGDDPDPVASADPDSETEQNESELDEGAGRLSQVSTRSALIHEGDGTRAGKSPEASRPGSQQGLLRGTGG